MSQQINLFNPLFVRRRQHFSLATMLQGLGAILLGALLLYGYGLYQVDRLSAESKEEAKRLNIEHLRLARYASEFLPQQDDKALREEVQRLERMVREQGDLAELLGAGAQGVSGGYSEYMRAFARQAVPGLWLSGFKVSGDGAQLSLSGSVVNPGLLPEYINRLSQESVMQGKSFTNLQMHQAQSASGAALHHVDFVLNSVSASEAKP